MSKKKKKKQLAEQEKKKQELPKELERLTPADFEKTKPNFVPAPEPGTVILNSSSWEDYVE